MPRTPNEYIVHILMEGGHWEEVRFPTIQEFQKWYSGELIPAPNDFISVPIKNIQGSIYSVHLDYSDSGGALALVWNDFRNDEKDYCIDDLKWSGDFDSHCHLLMCRCDRSFTKAGY